MPGRFGLLIRRAQLIAAIRVVEEQLSRAQSIIQETQKNASSARNSFILQYGANSVPNPDSGDVRERELVIAVERFRHIRETLELPLEGVLKSWPRDAAARLHVSDFRNVAVMLISTHARARFYESLVEAERSVEAAIVTTRKALSDPSLDLTGRSISFESESIQQYKRNNAAWVAAFEHLGSRFTPTVAPDLTTNRSVHGGLPADIALRVETTPLHRGPLIALLRRYQEFGSRYIVVQERSLLGDDMGLGKTVQVLAAMCHHFANGARHFFVVAPNGVVANWEREVLKHTRLRPIVVHGSDREDELRHWIRRGGVGITTYGTVTRLVPLIRHIDHLAVDEAQYVKNPDAQRTKAVELLTRVATNVTLMTGTALENRLGELRSLATMAQPGISSTLDSLINARFGRADPDLVQRELAPVYLRRTQSDVLTELPERIEIDEWVDLTPEDRVAYSAAPPLLVYKRMAATLGSGDRSSGKYQRLCEIVEEHRSRGRKILVFSFFLQVVDDVCSLVGGADRITGAVSSSERQRIIDNFAESPAGTVLVGQIDAGGIGVNLQSAQVVIIMEPQLKPSTEWHAIARAHRMGQSSVVTVHRLMARDTIEERIVELLRNKTQVFRAYAHDSAVRDASEMAIDPGSSLEVALQQILDSEEDA